MLAKSVGRGGEEWGNYLFVPQWDHEEWGEFDKEAEDDNHSIVTYRRGLQNGQT